MKVVVEDPLEVDQEGGLEALVEDKVELHHLPPWLEVVDEVKNITGLSTLALNLQLAGRRSCCVQPSVPSNASISAAWLLKEGPCDRRNCRAFTLVWNSWPPGERM